MRKVREVLRLRFENKQSLKIIARSLHISQSTVSRYVSRFESMGISSWEEVKELDELALEKRLGFNRLFTFTVGHRKDVPIPDYTWVHSELKKAGVTLELLWSEYKKDHSDGYGYTSFCNYYRNWKKKLSVTMRQSHRAGEKGFVDYSGKRPSVTDRKTSEKKPVELFIGVLGASSYTYAEATYDQSSPNWLLSHVRMYEYFKGVPEITVPDNLRSGVKDPCRYDPEINRSYQDLAEHYGTCIIPARVRKPKDKAKAEQGVQLVQRWILAVLRNQVFYSLSELNQAIWKCLEKLNSRKMKIIGKKEDEEYILLTLESVTREAILRFMSLSDSNTKKQEEILKEIDIATLDTKALKKLQKTSKKFLN